MNMYFCKTFKMNGYFDFCLLPNLRFERSINNKKEYVYSVTYEWLCFSFILTFNEDNLGD